MEFWFILFASLCLCISLHSLLSLLHTKKLPPGPPTIPFLGNILWLLKPPKISPTWNPSSADYAPNMAPFSLSISVHGLPSP
ncbi:hypothetical protein CsSME_00049014 [Camellia sinensis var. sinensis]